MSRLRRTPRRITVSGLCIGQRCVHQPFCSRDRPQHRFRWKDLASKRAWRSRSATLQLALTRMSPVEPRAASASRLACSHSLAEGQPMRSSRPRPSSTGVPRTARRFTTHPARPTGSERIHRTFQSQLSHRGPQCPSLRVRRGAPGADRRLVADLQQGAASRQPRPGAAPHVSAEAFISRRVSLCRVYLTGKLTWAHLNSRG